jgi:spermidine synthase
MARLPLIFAALCLALAPVRAEDFLKEFDSVYGHLIVRKSGSVVEMFARYKGWQARESGIDLDNPSRILVPYVKYLFAGSLVAPDPKNVLVIGLGGGGFNRLFNETYPAAKLTSVEIDPKVLELAKEYMGFQETPANVVAIRDGRSFIRRSKETYDWIILDAFHGSVVPPHLKTVDFYREAAAKLNPGGVLISNIHQGSELLYYDFATYREAFTDLVALSVSGSGNIILLAGNFPAGTLEGRLRTFDAAKAPTGTWRREIDPGDFAKAILPLTEAHFQRGRVMSDDFAPAEYFKIVPAPGPIALDPAL